MNERTDQDLACPLPISRNTHITLAHGGGGTRMHELIDHVFMKRLGNDLLDGENDAAVFNVGQERVAFTTDSFVVDPPFFPGGNIGSLAVHGTVNDLAMSGARPRHLSAGFILEEGFEIGRLEQVVDSMKVAADECGVAIVTGDTKVIERRDGDGIFINTAGIGTLDYNVALGPKKIQPGDHVIVSGDLGRHGMAIMTMREGFELEEPLLSDSAPLWPGVKALLDAGIDIRCLRDLTRGGLASALNELAAASGYSIRVTESEVPVASVVRGICELLGFDPLHVANEGRLVAFVPAADASRAVEALDSAQSGIRAADIGTVIDDGGHQVILESVIGTPRILDMLSGEQLPRIC
jgi:hydrogenase expression/formation protein HypE